MLAELGETLAENALLVTREDTYTRIDEMLVSMDEVG
jgi:hypothetical protein